MSGIVLFFQPLNRLLLTEDISDVYAATAAAAAAAAPADAVR